MAAEYDEGTIQADHMNTRLLLFSCPIHSVSRAQLNLVAFVHQTDNNQPAVTVICKKNFFVHHHYDQRLLGVENVSR